MKNEKYSISHCVALTEMSDLFLPKVCQGRIFESLTDFCQFLWNYNMHLCCFHEAAHRRGRGGNRNPNTLVEINLLQKQEGHRRRQYSH